MKNRFIYILACLLGGNLFFNSCDDYLDKIPDDRTELSSIDAISELLGTAYSEGAYIGFCEAMSDNVDDIGISGDYFRANEEAYFWEEKFSDSGQDSPDFFWNESYSAIAACNQALETIEELGTPKEALPYKGEALIARAYAHFMLVNIFSKSYNPETAGSDLGIPYITKPEAVVLGDYKRGSVAQVYEMIEKDITTGLPLIENQAYQVPKYHFNRAAANAFTCRYFLYKGDWAKVIQYSGNVLAADPANQMRDWNGDYQSMTSGQLFAKYTNSDESANLLLCGQSTLWARNFRQARYAFSYDKYEEIFSSKIFNGYWSFSFFYVGQNYFIPKYKEHFKYSSLNSTTGVPYVMAPVLTIEETLLNRAEAYAMNNENTLAIADLNTYLSKRIEEYDTSDSIDMDVIREYYKENDAGDDLKPFYTLSDDQLALVKCITDFRRVEFLHEGLRWFDIKRFHLAVSHKIKEESDAMELSVDDPRKECQIPEIAIEMGLEANPRD
jgi:hypothetical protein